MVSFFPQTVQVLTPSCVQVGEVSCQECLPVAATGRVSVAPQAQLLASSPELAQVGAFVCFHAPQLCE